MFPILFTVGPFTLRTVAVFFLLACVLSAFVFWRKAREEHYSESRIFDGFLVAMLIGYIASRAAYVVVNFADFGWDLLKWLNAAQHPGVIGLAGVIASSLYLYRYAKKQKWDEYELLDFWSIALAAMACIVHLGLFFDGSAFGFETQLPWGVRFVGQEVRHHPTQLYFALFYAVLFRYLLWAEYNYRTFNWYRAGKKTAQTGFLITTYLVFSGVFALAMLFVRPPEMRAAGYMLDPFVLGAVTLYGLILLFIRSGRRLGSGRKQWWQKG